MTPNTQPEPADKQAAKPITGLQFSLDRMLLSVPLFALVAFVVRLDLKYVDVQSPFFPPILLLASVMFGSSMGYLLGGGRRILYGFLLGFAGATPIGIAMNLFFY